jgi:hypothetical protein
MVLNNGGQFMRLNHIAAFLLVSSLPVLAQSGFKVGTVISSSQTGKQGNYYVEYWKDNGTGTMTLGEGCNFNCEWGQVGNILFRKGVRPGSKNEVIAYKADYQPQGNSYLSIYGWFENPLVEYYFIESWGSWKPPGVAAKGSFETDSGTYDIYQNSRTGASIKGNNTTFQQYWSVRRVKRTSGTITCANHFAAWEKAGMTIGTFYEVSFNVEAYQSSGGKANVVVAMDTGKVTIPTSIGHNRSGNVILPVFCYTPSTLYNILGQKITGMSGNVNSLENHSVMFNATNRASGVYFSISEGR